MTSTTRHPLQARTIAVTRAAHQAGELCALLEAAGATVLNYPAVAVAPPDDGAALDAALLDAVSFDWLIVTSANTARALAGRLAALHLTPAALRGPRVAAVGPTTAQTVQEQLGLDVATTPSGNYSAQALVAALGPLHGRRVWLPQSALAGDTLALLLRTQGAHVVATPAYCTMIGGGGDDLPGALRRGAVHAITFTSPSAVAFTLQRLHAEAGLDGAALAGVTLACIGPSTAQAVAAHGLHPAVVARASSAPGLVEAVGNYFSINGVQAHVHRS